MSEQDGKLVVLGDCIEMHGVIEVHGAGDDEIALSMRFAENKKKNSPGGLYRITLTKNQAAKLAGDILLRMQR